MKSQERKNLISGWPVYLLCVVLVAVMFMLYRQNLSKHGNEPLSTLITKNLKGTDKPFLSLDDVINSRKSWEPVLPDWQGKILPDLTFITSNGKNGNLSDYDGKQIILVIGATWYPPFKMQLKELQEVTSGIGEKNLVLIAVTAESVNAIQTFLQDNLYSFEIGSVEYLPEPYYLPDGFPILFFIDAQNRLKLAAVGLVPLPHAQAVLQLSLPEH